MYCLPFVALASEKTDILSKRFCGHIVKGFHSGIGGNSFRKCSIAVCTFEKAHSLIAHSVTKKYADTIKLVIVDEVHMMGDENRGEIIQSLLMKIKGMSDSIRVITLSATLSDDDNFKLSQYLNGSSFYLNADSPKNILYID